MEISADVFTFFWNVIPFMISASACFAVLFCLVGMLSELRYGWGDIKDSMKLGALVGFLAPWILYLSALAGLLVAFLIGKVV